MINARFASYGVLLVSLLIALPGMSQQRTVEDILAGKAIPFTLKAKEMAEGWRQFRLNDNGASNSVLQMIAARSEGQVDPDAFTPRYYSRGEIVTSEKEQYLVVYHRRAETIKLPQRMRGMPMPGNDSQQMPNAETYLTPETELVLSLINMSSLMRISDIQPFNLAEETAAAEKAREDAVKFDDAQRKNILANQLGYLLKSLRRWATAHNGTLPPMRDTASVLDTLHERPVFTAGPGQPAVPYAVILGVNSVLSGKKLAQFKGADWMVALYQLNASPDGKRLVGFLNGRVSVVTGAEFVRLCSASKMAVPAGAPRNRTDRR